MANIKECFADQLTPAEKRKSLQLLRTFHDACQAHGLAYSLSDGTALGYERHGGFIPWDDDMDVSVPQEQEELLAEVLADIVARDDSLSSTRHWAGFDKLFFVDGVDNGYDFRWPFLDIFHVAREDPHHAYLFPSRPGTTLFEGELTVQVPNDAERYLHAQFGPDWRWVFYDPGFTHRTERVERSCGTRSFSSASPEIMLLTHKGHMARHTEDDELRATSTSQSNGSRWAYIVVAVLLLAVVLYLIYDANRTKGHDVGPPRS